MDPTSETTTGAVASGIGKTLAISLITSLAAGGIAGFGVVYGPELMGVKPAVQEEAADSGASSSMVKPPDDSKESSVKKPATGKIADGFRMGTLAPTTPIQSIRLTLEVGTDGAEWKEPLDMHLGTGFPFRLYPVGGQARDPSFAAFPTSTSLLTGVTSVSPGASASFEFVADEKTKGLDVLRTTPHLLRDLKVGDLQEIGLACQGHSAWKVGGYRVEVNGQLYAEHGGLDLDVQKEVGQHRTQLGMLLPPFQALQQQLKNLEAAVKTGLATDADKIELEKVKAEIAKTEGPVDAMMGKVAGYAPWFSESDPAFTPAPLPGIPVKALQVTLATGGGEEPGTRNPVYLKAGGRKYLLASSADPLADEPKPQKFEITAADLEAQPLSQEDLKTLGIGVVGNDERSGTAPDRARLQRVVVHADGQTVYDSELKASDRKTLGAVWLVPPAHLDASGNVVENKPTQTEVYVWTPGMKPPVELAEVKPVPPPPPPPVIDTKKGKGKTDDSKAKKKTGTGTSTNQKGTKKGNTLTNLTGRGAGSLAGTSNPYNPYNPYNTGFGPQIRRTGFPFVQQQPVNTLGSLASLASVVLNALRPVPTPQVPTLSNARINPTTPVVSVGDRPTVQWNVSGNASQVARYRVELFAVLPELPGPRIGSSLATNNNVLPISFPVGGSTTISATVSSPINLSGLPASITAVQRLRLWVRPVITAFNAAGTPIQTTQGSLLPLFPATSFFATGGQVGLQRGTLTPPNFGISSSTGFAFPQSAPAPSFQLLAPPAGPLPRFADPNSTGGNSAWIFMPAPTAPTPAPSGPNIAWRMTEETDLSNQVLRFASHETSTVGAAVAYNTGLRPSPSGSGVFLQFEGQVPYTSLAKGFRVVGNVVFLSGSSTAATATITARMEVGPVAFQYDLDGAQVQSVTPVGPVAAPVVLPLELPANTPFFSLLTNPIPVAKTGARPQRAGVIDLPFRPDRFAQAATYAAANGLSSGGFVGGGPTDPATGASVAPGTFVPPLVYVIVNVWVQPLNSADLTEAIGLMGLRLVPDNT